SDILGMYVGQTEQRIRDAFAEAEASKAILFLDEIDGLLQNREGAHHSWEVTQVNELLQQMENFSGVLIGATNFSTKLDPATLRRFTYKLTFDYLDNAGKRLFFERMFKAMLKEDESKRLDAITHLTPGDFRTVRQSYFYLGGHARSNIERIEALQQEATAKEQERTIAGKIGF
ncbi:MAG: ATP-binding protein, partial [bacterium]